MLQPPSDAGRADAAPLAPLDYPTHLGAGPEGHERLGAKGIGLGHWCRATRKNYVGAAHGWRQAVKGCPMGGTKGGELV